MGDGFGFKEGVLIGVSGLALISSLLGCDLLGVVDILSFLAGDSGLGTKDSALGAAVSCRNCDLLFISSFLGELG